MIGLKIAVDLDGTIAEYKGWQGVGNIGKPLPHAKKGLALLQKAGFHVMIYTTRTNAQVNMESPAMLKLRVENWLKDNGIPYDEIYMGCGKPLCHFFLDDRAIPFVDWDQAIRDIMVRREAELDQWRNKA